MKKSCFLLFTFLGLATGKIFSQGITITGAAVANSSSLFTYYATSVDSIAPSGYSYTWNVVGGTVTAQNTDPYAGPVYCTIQWPHLLEYAYITVADNHSHSGIFWVEVDGLTGITAFSRKE